MSTEVVHMTQMTQEQRDRSRARNEAYAEQILDMFASGTSYRKISAATGVPITTVRDIVKRETAHYLHDRYGSKDGAVGRELVLLDRLTRSNLRKALDGDKDAIATVLECIRQRRRLLGLDAAIRVDATVRTKTDAEIEALIEQIGRVAQPLDDPDPLPREEAIPNAR